MLISDVFSLDFGKGERERRGGSKGVDSRNGEREEMMKEGQ